MKTAVPTSIYQVNFSRQFPPFVNWSPQGKFWGPLVHPSAVKASPFVNTFRPCQILISFYFIFGFCCFHCQTIEECLSRYQPSEVCVSFNGGKDCSALLHLIHAAWTKRNKGSTTDGLRLRALYIRGQDPFPEMEQFIEDTRQRHVGTFFVLIIPSTLSPPSGYPGRSSFLSLLSLVRATHSSSLYSISHVLSVSYSN